MVVLGLAAIVAAWWLFFTTNGRAARHDPKQAAADVRGFVHDHPVESAAGYVTVYVALGTLCLPVWWLQLGAGVAFGLGEGVGLSLAASAVGATVTARLADWFAGEWFHKKFEAGHARLKRLDQWLGHDGLSTVMAIRLTHVAPFGLSNIALGLLRIRLRDLFLGTLLGNIPAVAVYVGMGAGHDLRHDRGFDGAVVAVNVCLLVPLVGRYLMRRRGRRAPGFDVLTTPGPAHAPQSDLNHEDTKARR
jgi:uncharacterized membrane protein YdjX (TVP38/TMEM64 family)